MAASGGLAGVLRTFGPDWLASHTLSAQGAKVWRAIVACRTAALGGHIKTCDVCGKVQHVYHSCRNRHCPTCQTRTKDAWIRARRQELLPVPYFHLVFTLPHALNDLIGRHARALYECLFAAVSETLTEFAANPRHLGGEAAFSLILHTWQQDLGRHVHLHALFAGGALTNGGEWRAPKRGFLFPEKALSAVFRGKFMDRLETLRDKDGWRVDAQLRGAPWRDLKRALYVHDWVVYAKQPLGGPAQVLEYLGRYTHRVAISNERIVGVQDGQVAFRVRADPASGKKRMMRLAGPAFIDRFFLHVLPLGFKRIRHYGLLAPAHKTRRLNAARRALAAPIPDPDVIESVAAFMGRVAGIDWRRCTGCAGGHFVVTAVIAPQRLHGLLAHGPP
jgi:Putative transposase/Transposase zinc-binding domain